MRTVREIYSGIDRFAEFRTAESWDNCGILAGDPDGQVTKVMTVLDITKKAVIEAKEIGAQLIVSHHPVIFSPIRQVMADSPEGMMLRWGISAICVHTPFDMAIEGMNKGIYDIVNETLGIEREICPLEDLGNGLAIGKLYELRESVSPADCAARLKTAFGCTCVRFSDGGKDITRIALSSGSGGSFVNTAYDLGADALVSGDFKHDAFIHAENLGMTIIDCGHFHTERIFAPIMKDILQKTFPDIQVEEAKSGTDPVRYVL